MNIIQNQIDKGVKYLESVKGSGRTTRMVEEIVDIISSTTKRNIVVFAHSYDFASDILIKVSDVIDDSDYQVIGSGHMVSNDNVILFKGIAWNQSPGYKYQNWDYEFSDNSIHDMLVSKRISMLSKELL